jgi:hypothetical protein
MSSAKSHITGAYFLYRFYEGRIDGLSIMKCPHQIFGLPPFIEGTKQVYDITKCASECPSFKFCIVFTDFCGRLKIMQLKANKKATTWRTHEKTYDVRMTIAPSDPGFRNNE